MAGTITIRDAHTGGISPALNPADVLNAILAGDDILINNQTATIQNIGGPSGTWLLNGQDIGSFFAAGAPAGGTTTMPTPAQVCSGLPLAPPLPTPPTSWLANLPATITLQTAPTLPPQPLSSSLPAPGCVTLVVGGRQRASSTVADMQAAITGGASVLRADGSLALIQSLTAPGWPPNNWLIDGNPITAVLGQGFLPGQLDLIHSLAAQGLTIFPTLENVAGIYPTALPGIPSPVMTPIVRAFPVTPTNGGGGVHPLGLQTAMPAMPLTTVMPWIVGGAVLFFLGRRK